MTLFSREMLLATNGSEEAELAARVAVELAKSPGGGAIAKQRLRSRTVAWTIAGPFCGPKEVSKDVEAQRRTFLDVKKWQARKGARKINHREQPGGGVHGDRAAHRGDGQCSRSGGRRAGERRRHGRRAHPLRLPAGRARGVHRDDPAHVRGSQGLAAGFGHSPPESPEGPRQGLRRNARPRTAGSTT